MFRNHPACPCQASWLPAFEAEAQRRGILSGPLPLSQLIGGAAASGGTHTEGGADDTYPLITIKDVEAYVALSREMGADATWFRPYNWDGHRGVAHVHRVLTGCPHNGPARYQIDAVKAGYNGLGYGGHAARDDGPRPLSGRTWQEGLTWARRQRHPEEAMLADLIALRKKYGVSLVKLGRVAFRGAIESAGPVRAARIRTALAATKGM
jgi:hypothetical protein